MLSSLSRSAFRNLRTQISDGLSSGAGAQGRWPVQHGVIPPAAAPPPPAVAPKRPRDLNPFLRKRDFNLRERILVPGIPQGSCIPKQPARNRGSPGVSPLLRYGSRPFEGSSFPSLRACLPSLISLRHPEGGFSPPFVQLAPLLPRDAPLFVRFSPPLYGSHEERGELSLGRAATDEERGKAHEASSEAREERGMPALGRGERKRQRKRAGRVPAVPGGYFTPSSSTSKIRVAFPGITPPAPRAP